MWSFHDPSNSNTEVAKMLFFTLSCQENISPLIRKKKYYLNKKKINAFLGSKIVRITTLAHYYGQ